MHMLPLLRGGAPENAPPPKRREEKEKRVRRFKAQCSIEKPTCAQIRIEPLRNFAKRTYSGFVQSATSHCVSY